MKIAILFVILCVGTTITSAALYGTEITPTQEWWNDNYYLKFNSPIGKTFYINFYDGTISREKKPDFSVLPYSPIETTKPLNEETTLPFISFVSVDLNIYDIFFECNDESIECIPRLEASKFIYEKKILVIRHRLDSFVGPNKKLYQVVYDDGNELQIKQEKIFKRKTNSSKIKIAEKSPETIHQFQIKTVGPYEKWEHTYDFSENGELVIDHTISPIPVSANRSILIPTLEPIMEPNYDGIQTFAVYKAPSGTMYQITFELDIIRIPHSDVDEAIYITFTEPDGRTYDILFEREDGNAVIVEKSVSENYYNKRRLYSFVAPNRMLYRIDHKSENGHEVPILVSNSSDSSDLQITFCRPNPTYNMFVTYTFTDNGIKLFDRVDKIDWTPLNELPAIAVDEVTTDYVQTNPPSLTFYTPSGNNYHVFPNGTNASIAVQKGTIKTTQPLYISYRQTNISKANIYFVPGDHPNLEEVAVLDEEIDVPSVTLQSFVTPDKKENFIGSTLGDDNKWKEFVQLPLQVQEPIGSTRAADALSIEISNNENGYVYVYRFTWNGDKLIEAYVHPPYQSAPGKLLTSLVGK